MKTEAETGVMLSINQGTPGANRSSKGQGSILPRDFGGSMVLLTT